MQTDTRPLYTLWLNKNETKEIQRWSVAYKNPIQTNSSALIWLVFHIQVHRKTVFQRRHSNLQSYLLPTSSSSVFVVVVTLLYSNCHHIREEAREKKKRSQRNFEEEKETKRYFSHFDFMVFFFFRSFLFKETGVRSHFVHLHDTQAHTHAQTPIFRLMTAISQNSRLL